MINDFLNKSPVFKSTIGVNLNQQRLFPRSAGEREKRRTTTDRERGLLERRKERGKKTHNTTEEEDKEGSNNANRGLLF